MDPKYTTIDRFPLENSRRYAELLRAADKNLLHESGVVSSKVAISPTAPYYAPSEFDYLFSAFPSFTKAATTASFTPPSTYNIAGCFSETLVPALGSIEELEALIEKATPKKEGKEGNAVFTALERLLEKGQEMRLSDAGRKKFVRG